jgi:hypothetical protein
MTAINKGLGSIGMQSGSEAECHLSAPPFLRGHKSPTEAISHQGSLISKIGDKKET